jgi:DNA mismatch repair protein MutL
MPKINILPQNLINLIAAGEVVERPSSALKELIENSVDAHSTKIIVRLEDYGNKSIEVQDNGTGMSIEDAKLAFKQHATSKITLESDLSSINTLGFRGEALASISSVAESVTLKTKSENSSAVSINLMGQNEVLETSTQTENGTTISVNYLFKNIPARRKFLKSDSVELKHLTSTFLNVALSNLHIHFELHHNDKLVYRLSKTESLRDRVLEIWGGNIAKNFYDKRIYESERLKIEAHVGTPEIGKKVNPLQYIYVNNRFILNKTISSAAQEAFRGFIHKDLKPSFFIFITIDPSEVDVNIHPRKTEVRFGNSQEIFKIVYSLIKKTLEQNTKSIITDTIGNFTDNKLTKDESFDRFLQRAEKPQVSYQKDSRVESNFKPTNRINDALTFTQNLMGYSADVISNETVDNPNIFSTQTEGQLMQLFNTYIIFEKNQEIIFIDQHAAAEKILFEKLYSQMGDVRTKPLLVPEVIELTSQDKKLVMEMKNRLRAAGIVVADFGGQAIQILETPELIEKINIRESIEELVNDQGEYDKAYEKDKVNYANLSPELYRVLATAACHGSIRAGQKLSEQEMRNILSDLSMLKNPYNCPHGRPVMWTLEREDLEKNFRRRI